MGKYKRVITLALIMAVVTLAVVGVNFWLLYNTAFEEQRSRLVNMAQSSARMMESVALYDQTHFGKEHGADYLEDSAAATISQIEASHQEFKGFGVTGEFTLARRGGDQIVFILGHRHHDLDKPQPVPFDALKAAPMRRALSGLSGTMVGSDYRSKTVLAAYEPVGILDLGIVAKMDIAEIRAPFVKTGGIVIALTLLLITIGTTLFFRLGEPLINALRQSRERYRAIVQDHPEMLCRFLPDGTITFVNDAYCRFFGKSREELVGQTFATVVIQEDLEEVEEKVETLSKDDPVTIIKNRVIAADGEIRWTRWANQAIWDDEGHVIEYQSGGHDITEQVLAREELKAREKQLREAQRIGHLGNWNWNPETSEIEWSDEVYSIFGLDPETFAPTYDAFFERVHPDDRPKVEEAVSRAQEGESYSIDHRITLPDGSIRFVHEHGEPRFDAAGNLTRMDGTVQDISKISAVDQALRQSEEQFRNLFEGANDAIFIIDPETRRFIQVNDKAVERLGYTREELLELGPEDICPIENRERTEEALRELEQNGGIIFRSEQQRKDGSSFPIEVSSRIINIGGKLVYQSFVRDITERVNAEKELKHHRDHLEEQVAQRTAEVQEKATQLKAALEREKEYSSLQRKFVALVSHEFRTPLTIIDASAQRLIRRKDKLDADEVETRANKVRSAVTRMVSLIDTTLYASQMDAGKIEMKCSLGDIGELLLDVCERQAEIAPDHQFNVEVEKLPDEMWFDSKLLDQVFTNLFSNAVKYAPQAPHIEVKGWQEKEDVVIAIITVTDQGVGIPEDDLPHMFERFFRASTAEGIKGTGLGLSVCKEFVEMHGGSIGVTSEEGEGTTFTVRLPISQQADKELGTGI